MSIEQTLHERGARYGDFSDHARICQAIKSDMTDTEGWERLSDVQKQALEVIADKIARILSGDPNYADNWHDIQGYAKLAEDRLPRDALEAVSADFGITRMESAAQLANQMEDDSQRMAAIGQNGNTGEHYKGIPVATTITNDPKIFREAVEALRLGKTINKDGQEWHVQTAEISHGLPVVTIYPASWGPLK